MNSDSLLRRVPASAGPAVAFACVLLALPHPQRATAWDDTGHGVVAIIALRTMKDRDPAKAAKVLALLARHPDYERLLKPPAGPPSPAGGAAPAVEGADEYVFLRAAIWADLIRGQPNSKPKWHYVNVPFVPNPADAGKVPAAVQPVTDPPGSADPDNIVQAIAKCRAEAAAGSGLPEPDRAERIAWLMHLVGDIHQPLHCVAMFTSDRLPRGCQGGNQLLVQPSAVLLRPFSVKEKELPNLHSYWDQLAGLHEPPAELQKIAESLMAEMPAKSLERELAPDPDGVMAWVKEGRDIAAKDVYLDGKLEFVTKAELTAAWSAGKDATIPALPESYQKNAKAIARKRLALAGYRLAEELLKIDY